MTKMDIAVFLERLLALRARLRGDITQMEDNALNKDHNKTTSMPNHMAELGSGNFDKELTLSLLGQRTTPSTRLKRQSSGSKTAAMASAKSAVEGSPGLALRPSLMRPCAYNVRHNRKRATCRKPNEKGPDAGSRARITFRMTGNG